MVRPLTARNWLKRRRLRYSDKIFRISAYAQGESNSRRALGAGE